MSIKAWRGDYVQSSPDGGITLDSHFTLAELKIIISALEAGHSIKWIGYTGDAGNMEVLNKEPK